jgi:hypothetical protein
MKTNITIKIKSQVEGSNKTFNKSIVFYCDPEEIAWMHASPEDEELTVIQMKAGPQYLSTDTVVSLNQAWHKSRTDRLQANAKASSTR